MTVAVQTAFTTVLASAAAAAGVSAGQVHLDTAPASAVVPYVVYSEIPGRGPRYRTYDGSYLDEDIYQVACVAATRLAAATIRDSITASLDGATVAGVIQTLKDRNVPLPAPEPDQERFVSAVYIRVKYLGG